MSLLVPVTARADVVRFEIRTRAAVGSSGYEKITGVAHLAVDPASGRNRQIADIDLAPRNGSGLVEFSADVTILRPIDAAKSNGAAVLEVPNRGYPLILQHMNRAPGRFDFATDADLGDGFLMARGFTLVWVGWQFDLPRNGRRIGADLPRASGVQGIVQADFVPDNNATSFTVTDLAGYPPIEPSGSDTTLTVRDGPFGVATAIERSRFELRGNVVTLTGGYEPGRTYRIRYRAADPPISGLGLAAVRDVASWLRNASDAVTHPARIYGYGVSQSGRFLRQFLVDGFNVDERGRTVFDAVMPVGAGGARLDVNARWAQPNGNGFFEAATFPFADGRTPDPLTGQEKGLLDSSPAVKVFHINSGFEYWGAGRSAALTHTTPDGRSDVALPSSSRSYFFASATHAPGPFPPRVQNGAQPLNFVPFALRGLLVALDQWVRDGIEPPPSQYPRISDGTLVPAEQVTYSAIPKVRTPRDIPRAQSQGALLPLLVSQVDADGIDRGGIRLPLIAVPLGTYTGWNLRSASIGGEREFFPFIGSFVPFAATPGQRQSAADPRLSVSERYGSREEYLGLVNEATDASIRARFLVEEDRAGIKAQAEQLWDIVSKPN